MYIYVWLGHFAVQQQLTEHYKSTIRKNLKKKTERPITKFMNLIWENMQQHVGHQQSSKPYHGKLYVDTIASEKWKPVDNIHRKSIPELVFFLVLLYTLKAFNFNT